MSHTFEAFDGVTDDPEARMQAEYASVLQTLHRPTILVAGYTGSGKTSLIRAVCGPHVVPDERIGDGLPKTQDFHFYESDVIRLWDSRGLEAGETEAGFVARSQLFIQQLQASPAFEDHVHLTWYAIQGPGARVTSCDLRLVREIFPQPIVVITKADITKGRQLEAIRRALVDGGVEPGRIHACAEDDPESLVALVRLSHRLLPAAYRQAFTAAQRVDLARKWDDAQRIVHAAALAAAGAGGFPLPCSDAPIITGLQLAMIARLGVVYGEPAEAMRASLLPLVARTGGLLLASSLAKVIPILGGFVQAAVAAGLTEAVGQLVARQLDARARARLDGTPPPPMTADLDALVRAFDLAMQAKPWTSATNGAALVSATPTP